MTKIDLRPSSVSLRFTKHKMNTDKINGSKDVRKDNTRAIGCAIQLSGKVVDEPEEKRVEILKDVFEYLQEVCGKENFVVDVISLDDKHQQLYFGFVPVENGGTDATSMISCDRLKQYQDSILNHLQDTYPYLNFQYCTCQSGEPVLDDIEEASNNLEDPPLEPLEDFEYSIDDESDSREAEPDDTEDELDDVEDEHDDADAEQDRKHDKETGQNHQSLTEPIVYWKVAEEMMDDVMLISDRQNSQKERLAAVSRLRENLARCAMDKNLDELTAIYRDTMPTTKVNIGYDQVAVSEFIKMFHHQYPKPDEAVQHEENTVSDHESEINQADAQITEDQKIKRLETRMAKIENKLKDREQKDREIWLNDRKDLLEFRDLCLEVRDLCLEVRENDLMSRELCLGFDNCDSKSDTWFVEFDKKWLESDKTSLEHDKGLLDSDKVLLELDEGSLKCDKEWLERDKRDLKPREDELDRQEASNVTSALSQMVEDLQKQAESCQDELDRQETSKAASALSQMVEDLQKQAEQSEKTPHK